MIYLIDREHPLALYVFTKDKKVKETGTTFLVVTSLSVVADPSSSLCQNSEWWRCRQRCCDLPWRQARLAF